MITIIFVAVSRISKVSGVGKREERKKGKRRKKENGRKGKMGEHVGKCAKMKLFTKRVQITRKVQERKVLTILLSGTLSFFPWKS